MLNKNGESLPQYGRSEKKGSEELEESMHSVQLTNNASATCTCTSSDINIAGKRCR